jgi:hypothetical protein
MQHAPPRVIRGVGGREVRRVLFIVNFNLPVALGFAFAARTLGPWVCFGRNEETTKQQQQHAEAPAWRASWPISEQARYTVHCTWNESGVWYVLHIDFIVINLMLMQMKPKPEEPQVPVDDEGTEMHHGAPPWPWSC